MLFANRSLILSEPLNPNFCFRASFWLAPASKLFIRLFEAGTSKLELAIAKKRLTKRRLKNKTSGWKFSLTWIYAAISVQILRLFCDKNHGDRSWFLLALQFATSRHPLAFGGWKCAALKLSPAQVPARARLPNAGVPLKLQKLICRSEPIDRHAFVKELKFWKNESHF